MLPGSILQLVITSSRYVLELFAVAVLTCWTQLFSTHRGTEYLPSTLPTDHGTLHWSVTRDTNQRAVLIKVHFTTVIINTFLKPFVQGCQLRQSASTGDLRVAFQC